MSKSLEQAILPSCWKLRQAFASKKFFYIILAITIMQAVWYIVSNVPGLMDEGEHFGMTQFYSHRLSPFVSQQPQDWDSLGEIPRNPSYLFYYLMSWPLRIVALFTHSQTVQITCLRLIMLGFFVGGLILFRRLLLRLGASKALAHSTLLVFILIPAVAIMPGAYNYDNILFLLFPFMLLKLLDIVQAKQPNFSDITLLLVSGLLGCMMNVLFIGLFVPALAYLAFYLGRTHRRAIGKQLAEAYKKTGIARRIVLTAGLILLIGLFLERPVYNELRYHDIDPPCTDFMSISQCQTNYTAARNMDFAANKPADFNPLNLFDYTLELWLPTMAYTAGSVWPGDPLPVVSLLTFVFLFGGLALFLVYMRDFWRSPLNRAIIIVATSYTLILLLYLYSVYLELGSPVAISSRYLIPVLPLFIYFVAKAFARLARTRVVVTVPAFAVLLLLLTQGGGITTAALTAQDYERDNHVVQTVNRRLESTLHRLIVEHNPV